MTVILCFPLQHCIIFHNNAFNKFVATYPPLVSNSADISYVLLYEFKYDTSSDTENSPTTSEYVFHSARGIEIAQFASSMPAEFLKALVCCRENSLLSESQHKTLLFRACCRKHRVDLCVLHTVS